MAFVPRILRKPVKKFMKRLPNWVQWLFVKLIELPMKLAKPVILLLRKLGDLAEPLLDILIGVAEPLAVLLLKLLLAMWMTLTREGSVLSKIVPTFLIPLAFTLRTIFKDPWDDY